MVGPDIELDRPVVGTDRFSVDECVRLLWVNRYLQLTGFKVLRKSGPAEQNEAAKYAIDSSEHSMPHWIHLPHRTVNFNQQLDPTGKAVTATLAKLTDKFKNAR
jgi:hypothetical protein